MSCRGWILGVSLLGWLSLCAMGQSSPHASSGIADAGRSDGSRREAGRDPARATRKDEAGSIAIGGLVGTGYVAGGAGLAEPGTLEGNFQLISCPSGPCPNQAYVTLTGALFPAPWVPNTGSAQWIGPAVGGVETGIDPIGMYDYQEKFDLTGFDLSTVVVSGSMASDNGGSLELNGVPTEYSGTSFAEWTSFTLSSGFRPGVNTLDFLVANVLGGYFNPSGLIVEISGTGLRPTTTTSLVASPTNLIVGEALTLTGTVQGVGKTPPTGSAGFLNAGTVLATAPLDGSGVAVSTIYPAAGTYSIVAGYEGDGLNGPSESPAVTVTVEAGPPTFAITTSGPLTLQTQDHGSVTVTVTSQNGFSGDVLLGCGNVPQYVTCEWGSPGNGAVQVHVSGGPATVELEIDTSAVLGYGAFANPSGARTGGYGTGAAVASALGLLLFRRRRRLGVALCGLVLCVAGGVSGCSAKYPPSTAPGTYNIPILGSSGAIQNSGSLVLIVTK
jgi:hypothetical protein